MPPIIFACCITFTVHAPKNIDSCSQMALLYVILFYLRFNIAVAGDWQRNAMNVGSDLIG